MERSLKAITAMVLLMLLAVNCNKPEEPQNGGNDVQNDSIVDNGGSLNGHDYIDLGLPSGLMWATCNVGADTPEGFGAYYAWGELQPKEVYDWKSYRYGNDNNERYELTKYCSNSDYGFHGFTDSLTVLEPADDVAQAEWGSSWRMPTREDWEELFQNTTYIITAQNGVEGCLFTATNGNSLFLPAAGYWWGSDFNSAGIGVYWSSTINTEFPYRSWGYHINPDSSHVCGSSDRNRGQSVRAVCMLR